jgi:cysteinyl-tRNA synthetase
MSAHYKQPLDWNDKLIKDCQNTLDKWYRIYSQDIKSIQVTEEVTKPLCEDLNTPGYIANLHKLYENASKGKDKELFISACKFIGLLNENNEQWENYKKNNASVSEKEINIKIDLRNKARADKDYKEADRIRDELFDKGVLIEDKDGKTLWKFK